MKDFDEEIREALAQDPVRVPEQVHLRTEQLLESLPEKEPVRRLRLLPRITAMAASVFFVVMVLLPNVSPAYARSMEQIPVSGDLVQLFTIRTYLYDENLHNLDAQIPAVRDPENPDASRLINKDVDELTGEVIRQFYEELEFAEGRGVGSIHIDYELLTSTDRWFTMKLMVEETRGSTNSYARYYHIDRMAGTYVRFGDLVREEDFGKLEEMIRRQMEQQMAADPEIVYLEDARTGSSFVRLDTDQSFYLNADGDLVIVYDRYEVAPGFMGCPEFVLPRAEVEPWVAFPEL